MKRIISAMFDDRSQADAAVQRLTQELSVARSDVQLHAADAEAAATASTDGADTGIWASIKDMFVPDAERHTYAEGIRRGSTVVSAQVEEGLLDEAMAILEDAGAIDLDSRETEWRQAGWTSPSAGGVTEMSVASSTAAGGLGLAAGTGVAGQAMPETRAATTAGTLQPGVEQVVPVVAEQLVVGKRDVERGRVRVRSYVVETPVSEQVSLRQENLEVHRRPVDRPLTDADNAFREQTIEATATSEEAVVAKEARVVEEITIRKDAGEQVETVHETLRRQEVEVDETTGAQATAGNPLGTAASRVAETKSGTSIDGVPQMPRP